MANPSTGDQTLVVGTNDTAGGNVIVYSGTKKTSGNPVERAGFTWGQCDTISVPPLPVEDGSADVPTEPMAFTLSTGTGTGWDRLEAPVRS